MLGSRDDKLVIDRAVLVDDLLVAHRAGVVRDKPTVAEVLALLACGVDAMAADLGAACAVLCP